ncbi:hypothetical protein B7P34_21055, partial [Streptosporangium nondiastaticum]
MSGGGPEGAAVPPGRVVAGRYRLLEQLGRGGMGVVWRARDEVLDREVAVKEVRAPAGLLDHEIRQLYVRLEREARAAARIAHPHVVTVFDVASDEGRPWIVMELVRGLSLADALQAEGPLPPAHAAHIGAGVLAALRGAHAAGVLHRDVKPGNVLLANDGRVVLTDFGIATVEGSSALTRTGELVGSPEFLAPERALGHPPGPASDLWSLGVTLYATVEGVSPFRQDTPLSTMRAVVDQQLPAPVRAGALAPVLEGLLRKDPALRLGAAEAEDMLRVVARGGTVSGAGAPPGPARMARPLTPLPELDAEAARALVETDDAVRTSAEELHLAAAQLGDAAVRPFAEAVAYARSELADAFRLRQALDDAPYEDEEIRRRTLDEICSHCTSANRRLDAESASFDVLRGLRDNAAGILARAEAAAEDLAPRVTTAEGALHVLAGHCTATALAAVARHPAEARDRLSFATAALAEARRALAAGDGDGAA